MKRTAISFIATAPLFLVMYFTPSNAEDDIYIINFSPLPRIQAVRTGTSGQGYFRYSGTSTIFTPRGNNYIRLDTANGAQYHSTFQPQHYNSTAVISALNQMSYDGYNIVRVFIDPGHWMRANSGYNGIAGDYNTQTRLNSDYMDRVAHFVSQAASRGIYVTFTLDSYPWNQFYRSIVQQNDCSGMESPNKPILCLGDINAKKEYVKDFANGINQRIGSNNLSAVFSYSLQNELSFSTASLPFSRSDNWVVQTARGPFNMSSNAERQHAADSNMTYWANQSRASIKSVDPDALVTVGFFTYRAVGKSGPNGLLPLGTPDPRFPGRPKFLTTYSNIDFIDLHVWNREGTSYSMPNDLASIEWSGIYGPLVMGEFGAPKNIYSNITQAALTMKSQQIESCDFNFDGWIFWTFDTTPAEQSNRYNLIEQGGAINGQLAPIVRPNPCS